MATYTPVPRAVPSSQRSVQITNVSAGDQIDLRDALGRPARKLQFHVGASTDIVEYTLNNLRRIRTPRDPAEATTDVERAFGTYGTTLNEVWSAGAGYSSYSSTGSTVLETADGLEISSLQIDALTLGVGATITIIAW